MDFAAWPPEVNSGLMYSGPGSGPLLAAAAGWDALAASLDSTASGYSTVISGLVGQAWSGPTSLAMAVCRTAACGLLSTASLAPLTPRMPSGYADVPNKRCVCVCVKGVKCCKRWSLTEAALLASSEARSKERYS